MLFFLKSSELLKLGDCADSVDLECIWPRRALPRTPVATASSYFPDGLTAAQWADQAQRHLKLVNVA